MAAHIQSEGDAWKGATDAPLSALRTPPSRSLRHLQRSTSAGPVLRMQRSASLTSLDTSADQHRRAAERSINSESLEYKTPPGLAMSRKYAIDLSASALVAPERQALLQAFKWRRFRHPRGALHTGTQGGAGKEWIVVPSLSPSEVARVDAAGRSAASAPQSPRGGQQVSAGAIRDDGLQVDKFALAPDDPAALQYPEPGGAAPTRDVGVWQWRRLFLGVGAHAVWVCIPSLHKASHVT